MNQKQKEVYSEKCYSDTKISKGIRLSDKFLIENQIDTMTPDLFMIFGKINKTGNKHMESHLVVQTNAMIKWKLNKENFLWKSQGNLFLIENKLY